MDDERLHTVSLERRGVLGLDDAPSLGLTREALSEHARRNSWQRPHRGAFLVPGTRMGFVEAVLVAVRAAGSRRVLVGRRAAAYLWGMTRDLPEAIELVVPANRHDPELDGLVLTVTEEGEDSEVAVRVWRSRTLTQADATDLGGIPVTSPARTAVDLAAVLAVDELRSVVIDARQRRIVRLAEIDRLHRRIPRYPGRPKVTRVLADLDEQDCDSRLEWDFREAARPRGFSPFPRPFPFRCSDGVTIEVDVAWPAEWVAGECDGFGSHSQRSSLTKHHKRQNRAVADGWRPFLIDWTRLKHDPDGLFADLAALLATPAGRPPAPMAEASEVDPRFRSRRRRRR